MNKKLSILAAAVFATASGSAVSVRAVVAAERST